MYKAKEKENLFYLLAFCAVGCVAVFLRVWHLANIPYGLHIDEAGLAYNALHLANFGTTVDLAKFPVYINDLGGKSAMYIYFTALLIRLFGAGIFVYRLTAALFSLLNIVFGALLFKERFGRKGALVGASFLAIMPYFVMQGRWALDCNLMMAMSTMALYFFYKAVQKQKHLWFVLAGTVMGLLLYTYIVSYVVLPVFLLFVIPYLLYIKKINLRQMLALGIPLCVLAFPLILFVIVNVFDLKPIQVLFFTIPKLPAFTRTTEFGLAPVTLQLKNFFSCTLFYDNLAYNAFEKYYTMYAVSIPFALKGLEVICKQSFAEFKKRIFSIDMLVLMFLFSIFTLAMAMKVNANINRLNAMYFCWAYIVVYGIFHVYNSINKKKLFAGALAVVYLFGFLSFARYYFFEYPTDIYPQIYFSPLLQPALQTLEEVNPEGQNIYFISSEQFPGSLEVYYKLETQTLFEEDIPPNYHFEVRDVLQDEAYYVVQDCDYQFIELLLASGRTKVTTCQGYDIYH